LHHEKLKNEKKAKEDFDKRVFESKKKAIEANIELAKKTGNTLTQTMDENGNLVGVRENVNFEDRDAAEDIKKKNK
jgi:predicted chitinase